MKLQNLKGTNDYSGREMLTKNRIVTVLKKTFEKFGFEPLETPTLAYYNILSSKDAGGSEILKETYRLKDQGKRDLALRYDLTVPFCRFIGMNPNMKFPYKRYEIGKVFRDGPIKLGRVREFSQCDADIVGVSNMQAEAECLALTIDAFNQLGLPVRIEINNRKVLIGLLSQAGVLEKDMLPTILTIDKLKKQGQAKVKKELESIGLDKQVITKVFKNIQEQSTNKKTVSYLLETLKDDDSRSGASELDELISLLSALDLDKYVSINLTLARGLGYYTGTMFEWFLKNNKVTSSVCAGGRYDKMIGKFLDSKTPYPTVGISFGLETIATAMKDTAEQTSTKIFIIPIGEVKQEAFKLAKQLRDKGINTDIDLLSRGPSKNLDYVNSKGIPFALMIGPKEIASKKFTLRNMETGRQEHCTLKQLTTKFTT
ncbi:histidine--tRNA ligase [archaeon]|nr:histidine--tRNA ligase [archaeon]|tara:strand:+ start:2760 stop:4046 length:1287 start_codon:yes stop_codon:yes gene_type:complete